MKSIYDLDLHEEIKVEDNLWAIRVPGGWIYSNGLFDNKVHCVFVPYDNEFYTYEKEEEK